MSQNPDNTTASVSANTTASVSANTTASVSANTTAPVSANTTAPVSANTTAPVSANTTAPVSANTTAPVSAPGVTSAAGVTSAPGVPRPAGVVRLRASLSQFFGGRAPRINGVADDAVWFAVRSGNRRIFLGYPPAFGGMMPSKVILHTGGLLTKIPEIFLARELRVFTALMGVYTEADGWSCVHPHHGIQIKGGVHASYGSWHQLLTPQIVLGYAMGIEVGLPIAIALSANDIPNPIVFFTCELPIVESVEPVVVPVKKRYRDLQSEENE